MDYRRIRLTVEGGIFLVTGTAVALAALNTGNNLLYLLLSLLLGLLVISGVLSEAAIRSARPRRRLTGRVFAGVPVSGQIELGNPRRFVPHLAVRIDEVPPDRRLLIEPATASFPVVPAGERRVRAARWHFSRRGLHALTTLRVSTAWPFGILRKWYDVPDEQELIVLPSPRHARGEERPQGVGVGSAQRVGRGGAEPMGLRVWRAGEDRRAIHWRTTARRQQEIIVEREEDDSLAVRVDVPIPGPGDPAARSALWEDALSCATGAILDAESRRQTVVLRLPGRELATGVGRDHGVLLVELALAKIPEIGV